MKRKMTSMAVTALAIVALAGCSSGAGLGDIFGGGGTTNELRGRVDYVDVNNQYVVLTNVSGYGNMLSSGGGDSVRVYFDSQTPVEYQGQTYRPADLERGDEIAVRYEQSGNNIVAREMNVLYDSSTGGYGTGTGTGSGSGVYDQTIRGTVRYVDPSRRTIEIDRGGYGGITVVEYSSNTPVTYQSRTYNPQDLERGDEIEIRVRDLGNGRYLAENIYVTRSMSSGGGGTYGNQTATVRGTVRYVDTNRREIALDQASYTSGFNTGAGTGSTLVIRYDNNTNVEYGGRLYAPTNLERGDLVDVQLFDTTGTPLASRIVVVRDVNNR
jgi:hypothetical protein